jgi:hypothetical protein
MLMDFLLQRRTEIKFDVDDPLSEIMKRVADATGSKIAGFGGADPDGAVSTVGFGGDAAAAVPAKLLQIVSKRRAPEAPAPPAGASAASASAAPEADEGAAPPPAKRPSPDAAH